MPLWVADMDFEVGSFIQDAISKRIKNKTYGYEIIPSDIKENISLWLEKRQNYTVDTNHIILTSGLLTTMNQCVELFTKVHDNIIIQTPIYPPFYDAVQKNNRHILENKLRFDGTKYVINFEELEEQMKDASMMIFCSPHNPVGRVWIKEELERIAALSIKYNVIIISDEVHFDIVYSNSKHICLSSLGEDIADNVITLAAPSKTFNIAGLCTSYAIIQNDRMKIKLENQLKNYHMRDMNAFAIVATQAAYKDGEQWVDSLVDYLESNRDFIVEFFKKNMPKVKVIIPEATYLIWLDFRKYKLPMPLQEFLVNEAKLGLNSGESFGKGYEKYARLNFALPLSQLEKALNQLKDALNKYYPRVIKNNEEWKKILSEEQFKITRRQGTERAFSGLYWDTKEDGNYHCICCDSKLFSSNDKFDSGTGWPSYTKAIDIKSIDIKLDKSHNMTRQETLCAVCDAHLGHLFADTKSSTGQRYCINSAALKLK